MLHLIILAGRAFVLHGAVYTLLCTILTHRIETMQILYLISQSDVTHQSDGYYVTLLQHQGVELLPWGASDVTLTVLGQFSPVFTQETLP